MEEKLRDLTDVCSQDGIDPKEEARLVRKLDFHIIPVVMLLYLLSFLDRSVENFY